mgnify:CR=1 FL=1
MRKVFFIVQKEFLQIFRNRAMLPIIILVPVIQLIILVHAATFEIKNIDMIIVDHDLSSVSKNLAAKFEGSKFFNIRDYISNLEKAILALEEGQTEVIINIKTKFEKDIR